jgi:hypothetical protein
MAVEQSREIGLCVGGETRKRKTERELSGKKKFASVFVAHNSFQLIVVGADCRPLFWMRTIVARKSFGGNRDHDASSQTVKTS